MTDTLERFSDLSGRLFLDACVLNRLFDGAGYVFEGELERGTDEVQIDPDLRVVRASFAVNERASFRS